MPSVQECMTTAVVKIRPTASVDRARRLLREHGIHRLPVVDAGRLAGIVTDRDLRDAMPSPPDASGSSDSRADVILVRDVMTAPVVAIHPLAPVSVAAMIMESEGLGSLPVADEGELLGIITRSDVLHSAASRIGGPRRSVLPAGLCLPPDGDIPRCSSEYDA